MKNRLLPAGLIGISIALVAVGGVALATGGASERQSDILDRVATILGVPSGNVQDAFQEAGKQIQDERQAEMLAALVEDGVITGDQADSAAEWLESRPESADRLLHSGRVPGIGIGIGSIFTIHPDALRRGVPGPGFSDETISRMAEILGVDPDRLRDAFNGAEASERADARAAALSGVVDRLVDEGELTADEGVELKAWLADMPDFLQDSDVLARVLSAVAATAAFGGLLQGHADGGLAPFIPFGPGAPREPRLFPFRLPGIPDFRGDQFNFDGREQFRFRFEGPGGRFEFDNDDLEAPGPLFERFRDRFPGIEELLKGHPFYHDDDDEASAGPAKTLDTGRSA